VIATAGSSQYVLINGNHFVNSEIHLTGASGAPTKKWGHPCADMIGSDIVHEHWVVTNNSYSSSSGLGDNWITHTDSILRDSAFAGNNVLSGGISLSHAEHSTVYRNTFQQSPLGLSLSGMAHDLTINLNTFSRARHAISVGVSGNSGGVAFPIKSVKIASNTIDGMDVHTGISVRTTGRLSMQISNLEILSNTIAIGNGTSSRTTRAIDLKIETDDSDRRRTADELKCSVFTGFSVNGKCEIDLERNHIRNSWLANGQHRPIGVDIAGGFNSVALESNRILRSVSSTGSYGVALASDSAYGKLQDNGVLKIKKSIIKGWETGVLVYKDTPATPWYMEQGTWLLVRSSDLYNNTATNILAPRSGTVGRCGSVVVAASYLGSSNVTLASDSISACSKTVALVAPLPTEWTSPLSGNNPGNAGGNTNTTNEPPITVSRRQPLAIELAVAVLCAIAVITSVALCLTHVHTKAKTAREMQ
jgi:hypothetical protein